MWSAYHIKDMESAGKEFWKEQQKSSYQGNLAIFIYVIKQRILHNLNKLKLTNKGKIQVFEFSFKLIKILVYHSF